MTTKNFVPRINGEGQIGTEVKKWSKIYSDSVYVNNVIGDLNGTADNAIKDSKDQQIDSTYIKNISANNDTLTITKGNDNSQDITINNISHAISSDNATNASKLQGLTAGNSNGQIPINNGVENVNLNAALLNGKSSNDFATNNHTHNTATQSSNGYMSNTDKKKLDGIASGAEVNQNAFANVKVGSNTIQADAKQDTLTLAAGANISLVGDANNDKVTIGVTGKVASASQADNATNATKATNATNADVSKKVNNTATNGSAIDLVTGTMANNDYFRIRIGGKDDSGYAEIATSDNGSEPIYIRQYAGSNFGFSDTPARTATILDSSGNTSFPGKVTASGGFSGNLSGTTTKAIADKNGLQIDTNYLKLSGGTMTGNISVITPQSGYWRLEDNNLKINIGFANDGFPRFFVYNAKSGITPLNVYANDSVDMSQAKLVKAPTPSTGDNSTQIATTAFVQSLLKNKFTANKATNGWWKDGNTGMIFQWGTWSINSTAGAASTSVTFPISFPNKCLIVIPSVFNAASDQIGYNFVTNTGCKIAKGVNDASSARNGIYLVIGY